MTYITHSHTLTCSPTPTHAHTHAREHPHAPLSLVERIIFPFLFLQMHPQLSPCISLTGGVDGQLYKLRLICVCMQQVRVCVQQVCVWVRLCVPHMRERLLSDMMSKKLPIFLKWLLLQFLGWKKFLFMGPEFFFPSNFFLTRLEKKSVDRQKRPKWVFWTIVLHKP